MLMAPARSSLATASALRGDGGLEVRGEQPLALEQRLHPVDRVLGGPVLEFVGVPVAGGVVRRRVRAHPVGHGLDEGGAAAAPGTVQGNAGGGHDGQDIVAVHPHAGDAEA